ncbi:MAG: RNA-protein complex protein Nop10 [Candidatus Aenigmarchaeota archaeon]|nr:RNA-protein complex protein Nop10 [Candidatus Aenigmarchaeota archaeon]
MRRCASCQRYTFDATCHSCGSATRDPKPPKFSPEDRYGRYRRMAKAKIKES